MNTQKAFDNAQHGLCNPEGDDVLAVIYVDNEHSSFASRYYAVSADGERTSKFYRSPLDALAEITPRRD